MSDLMKTLGQTMAPQQTAPEGTTWQAGMPASSVTAPYENPATAAPGGGFGGVMQGIGQGIGKVASNPLTLAALQGYARALAMPRGAGPITRTVGGLASGLEDYYVTSPYRTAATEKMKQDSQIAAQKAKLSTQKAQRTEEAYQKASPEMQQASALGGPQAVAALTKQQGQQQQNVQAAAGLRKQAESAQGEDQQRLIMGAELLESGVNMQTVSRIMELPIQAAIHNATLAKEQQQLENAKSLPQYREERLGQGERKTRVAEGGLQLRRDIAQHPELYPGAKKGGGDPLANYPGLSKEQINWAKDLKSKWESEIEKAGSLAQLDEYAQNVDPNSAIARADLLPLIVRAANSLAPNASKGRMTEAEVNLFKQATSAQGKIERFFQQIESGYPLNDEQVKQVQEQLRIMGDVGRKAQGEITARYRNRAKGLNLPEGFAKQYVFGEDIGETQSTAPQKATPGKTPSAGKMSIQFPFVVNGKTYSTMEEAQAGFNSGAIPPDFEIPMR